MNNVKDIVIKRLCHILTTGIKSRKINKEKNEKFIKSIVGY